MMTRRLERDADVVRGSNLVATSVVRRSTGPNDPRRGVSATTHRFHESPRTCHLADARENRTICPRLFVVPHRRKNPTAREGASRRVPGLGRLPATRPRRLERCVRGRHRASALRTPSDLPPHASLPARRSSSRVPRRSSSKTIFARVRKNNLSSLTIALVAQNSPT